MPQYIEDNHPPIQSAGLNTKKTVDFSASPTVALPSATTINGSTVTSLGSITSTSATAFTVASTSTNYGLQIDESTSSAITGLKIKAAASGNGVALSALGGTNEGVKLDGKGTGTVGINTVGTTSGLVTIGNSSSLAGALINGPLNFAAKAIDANASTLAPTAAQSGSVILLDRAAGCTVTLPAPVVGTFFDTVVVTTVTSNSYKVITDTGTTLLAGFITSGADNTANKSWVGNGSTHVAVTQAAASTNATGGIVGSWVRYTCVSSTLWAVSGLVIAGGTPTTPFATS